ncbi:MAG: hypothetical protein ABUK01_18285 [Leptospirales bacterium]
MITGFFNKEMQRKLLICVFMIPSAFSYCSKTPTVETQTFRVEKECEGNNISAKQADSWSEVSEILNAMTDENTYAQIKEIFGKPLKEAQTESLPEEYILVYEVPCNPGKIFWIMLDTNTKHFRYWSDEQFNKNMH